jgi:hypothetical protein
VSGLEVAYLSQKAQMSLMCAVPLLALAVGSLTELRIVVLSSLLVQIINTASVFLLAAVTCMAFECLHLLARLAHASCEDDLLLLKHIVHASLHS